LVGSPAACADSVGNLAQKHIAFVMTEGIIHFLEKVKIQEYEGKGHTAAPRLLYALLQLLVKHLPVGQLGQMVEVGLPPNLGFPLASFGDIREQADAAIHRAVVVEAAAD